MIRRVLSGAVAVMMLATAACSDSTDPNEDVAGTYEATELTLTDAGGDTDVLALGGGITITLTDNGQTSGTLLIPGELSESGLDETVSLAGTYDYDPDSETVEFEHASDTFIRDVVWDVSDGRLDAVFVDAAESLEVRLERLD